jgi:hypothetical protein
MGNNIPTAEDFLNRKYSNFKDLDHGNIWTNIEETMKEFAKLHCEAQLKAILENVNTKQDVVIFQEGQYIQTIVDKESIENAYPLDNIK